MEEAWMRDRAFLRQHPQASPQELARMTGRSVSWVKKWRKRLIEGDPHDPICCVLVRGRIMPPTSVGMSAADLVAFRADPITCPVDDIPSLRPTFTIVGGRAFYDLETALGEKS